MQCQKQRQDDQDGFIFYRCRASVITSANRFQQKCSWLYCRRSGDVEADRLRLLHVSILPCHLHVADPSQVSVLHHQSRSSVLSLLDHRRHHVHAACRFRRTRRHRYTTASFIVMIIESCGHCVYNLPSKYGQITLLALRARGGAFKTSNSARYTLSRYRFEPYNYSTAYLAYSDCSNTCKVLPNPAPASRLFWLPPTFLCCLCTGYLEQYTCFHPRSGTLGTFKTALKTHLFNSAYTSCHWQPSIGASDYRDFFIAPTKEYL